MLCHCFSHGCAIVLTEAARHDSFLTHFLMHILLHAGRIFRQWHHNHIICLVIESALHVYKGQLSPWFGQFNNSQFRHYWNSHITGILIQQNSSNLLPALYSLKCLTSRVGVKTHRFGLKLTSPLRSTSTFRSDWPLGKSTSNSNYTYLDFAWVCVGSWESGKKRVLRTTE